MRGPKFNNNKRCQEKLLQYNAKNGLNPSLSNNDITSTTPVVNKGDAEIRYDEDSDENSEYEYADGFLGANCSMVNTCNHDPHPNDSLEEYDEDGTLSGEA